MIKQDRNQQIVHLYTHGISTSALAEQFHISATRVQQIVRRAKQKEELPRMVLKKIGLELIPGEQISTHTLNVLCNFGRPFSDIPTCTKREFFLAVPGCGNKNHSGGRNAAHYPRAQLRDSIEGDPQWETVRTASTGTYSTS